MSDAAALSVRVEGDVVSDEKLPRPQHGCPGGGMEPRRATIGLPSGVFQLLGQALILAPANVGQVGAPGVVAAAS